MKPLPESTMVEFRGKLYFVQEVLKMGDDPWYVLRTTVLHWHSTNFTVAAHSELTVRGGVLIGESDAQQTA